MGEEADDIFESLGLTAEEKKQYGAVKEKFEGYFIPRRNVIFERAVFNQRVQKEGESVDNFITSLYTLSEHCEFGALREEMIRDRIVVGILNSKLSRKLQLERDLKLADAVSQARQDETVRQQQAAVRNDDAGIQVDEMMRKEKYQQRSKFDKSNKSGRCGWSPAHPKVVQDENDSSPWVIKLKLNGADHTFKIDTGADITVQDENDPSPWVIKRKLNGAEHTFKIDTGADITVIYMETARHLGVKLMSQRRLQGPGQVKLPVRGQFFGTLLFNLKVWQEEICG